MNANNLNNIMRLERNELTNEEALALVRELVETGDIWQLPTNYLDRAAELLAMGQIPQKRSVKLH